MLILARCLPTQVAYDARVVRPAAAVCVLKYSNVELPVCKHIEIVQS